MLPRQLGRVKSRILFGTLTVLALGSTPAAGQSTPDQADPRSSARFHLGPFYLTPTVLLKDLGIDTNVFNTTEDRKKDFTITIGPTINAFVPLGRARITTTETLNYVYFHTFVSQRSMHIDTTVGAEYPLGRFTFSGGTSFLHTSNRLNFEIDARAHRQENIVNAAVSFRASPKLEFGLSGRDDRFTYEQDSVFLGEPLRNLDRVTHNAGASIKYALTPLTTIIVSGGAISDRFPISPSRNTDSVNITPGVEFKPLALISGNASIGFRRFQTLTAEVPDFSGVILAGNLSYTLLGRTVFTVTANRGLDYSFETAYPYYLGESFGLSIRQRLGGGYDFIVGAERTDLKYRRLGEGTDRVIGPQRVDTGRSYSLGVGHSLSRVTRLDVLAAYSQRHSNAVSGRDYAGWRIMSSMSHGF